MHKRSLKFYEAIREAIDLNMAENSDVYLIGLGVTDPKGVFGTTLGLQQKYGSNRVMDMPVSENGVTGVAIGSALVGMRPIISHQRIDFAIASMEQIVNQAANWHYMFGGQISVPLVIKIVIGRGWGQGPQHSQSLQTYFAHIPGLKVVMPTTPYDAKGLLTSSIQDNNPVIFIEHRWLHNITGHVPKGLYQVPIGQPKIIKKGRQVTIVSISYMTLEAISAAEMLEEDGISVEIIDLLTLKPLDDRIILESVRKTGRLIVADIGWSTAGFCTEVITRVVEKAFKYIKAPPKRLALPDCPTPTSPALAKYLYIRDVHIYTAVKKMLGYEVDRSILEPDDSILYDVPDSTFIGPF